MSHDRSLVNQLSALERRLHALNDRRWALEKKDAWLQLKFPPGWSDFPAVLDKVIVAETRRHKSLLKIIRLTEPRQKPHREFLAEHGLSEFEPIPWASTTPDDHTDSNGSGGEMIAVRAADGSVRTVVVLTNAHGLPAEQFALAAIAVFLHEMGHVDDLEHCRNAKPGEPADFRALELYAHRYACRRMMAANCRASLKWYLGVLSGKIVNAPDRHVREAAKDFVASGEFRSCSEFSASATAETFEEVMKELAAVNLEIAQCAAEADRLGNLADNV